MNVVLPPPEGPVKATKSPGSIVERYVLEHIGVGGAIAERNVFGAQRALDLDRGSARSAGSASAVTMSAMRSRCSPRSRNWTVWLMSATARSVNVWRNERNANNMPTEKPWPAMIMRAAR